MKITICLEGELAGIIRVLDDLMKSDPEKNGVSMSHTWSNDQPSKKDIPAPPPPTKDIKPTLQKDIISIPTLP